MSRVALVTGANRGICCQLGEKDLNHRDTEIAEKNEYE
jgi:hypothetical protein